MISVETPLDFLVEKNIDSHRIYYKNLMEIVQGGPEVGSLIIDEHPISTYQYGGPFLIEQGHIVIPKYQKNFWSSGFKLAKINLITIKEELITSNERLIYLSKIDDDIIYYYTDLNRLKMKMVKF